VGDPLDAEAASENVQGGAEVEAKVEGKVEAEGGAEVDVSAEAEGKAETEAASEVKADTEVVPEVAAAAEAEAETETEAAIEAEAEAVIEAEAEAEAEAVASVEDAVDSRETPVDVSVDVNAIASENARACAANTEAAIADSCEIENTSSGVDVPAVTMGDDKASSTVSDPEPTGVPSSEAAVVVVETSAVASPPGVEDSDMAAADTGDVSMETGDVSIAAVAPMTEEAEAGAETETDAQLKVVADTENDTDMHIAKVAAPAAPAPVVAAEPGVEAEARCDDVEMDGGSSDEGSGATTGSNEAKATLPEVVPETENAKDAGAETMAAAVEEAVPPAATSPPSLAAPIPHSLSEGPNTDEGVAVLQSLFSQQAQPELMPLSADTLPTSTPPSEPEPKGPLEVSEAAPALEEKESEPEAVLGSEAETLTEMEVGVEAVVLPAVLSEDENHPAEPTPNAASFKEVGGEMQDEVADPSDAVAPGPAAEPSSQEHESEATVIIAPAVATATATDTPGLVEMEAESVVETAQEIAPEATLPTAVSGGAENALSVSDSGTGDKGIEGPTTVDPAQQMVGSNAVEPGDLPLDSSIVGEAAVASAPASVPNTALLSEAVETHVVQSAYKDIPGTETHMPLELEKGTEAAVVEEKDQEEYAPGEPM
jgi:hypothetical protein